MSNNPQPIRAGSVIELAAQRMEAQAKALHLEATGKDDEAANLIIAAQAEADAHMVDAQLRVQKIQDQADSLRDEADYWTTLAGRERDAAGNRKLTVLRHCNGCGQPLSRNLSPEESDAAAAGAVLPDTRSECPTCNPAAAQQRVVAPEQTGAGDDALDGERP